MTGFTYPAPVRKRGGRDDIIILLRPAEAGLPAKQGEHKLPVAVYGSLNLVPILNH